MERYEQFVNRYSDIFTLRTINALYRYSHKIQHNDVITKNFLMAFLAEPNFYNGLIVRREIENYIKKI